MDYVGVQPTPAVTLIKSRKQTCSLPQLPDPQGSPKDYFGGPEEDRTLIFPVMSQTALP